MNDELKALLTTQAVIDLITATIKHQGLEYTMEKLNKVTTDFAETQTKEFTIRAFDGMIDTLTHFHDLFLNKKK